MSDPVAPIPEDLHSAAVALFGAYLDKAVAYAEMLATDGVVRGLIGPRETDRIWSRHVLNCAAMAPLIKSGAYVVDVGSGAGLPGLVLAIARPDITTILLEPLARRTAFLTEAVEALDLGDRVVVVRGRAEEVSARPAMFHVKPADVVTARAVAPLDRLAEWCLPLAATGGLVLAMKGSSAPEEIAAHRDMIERMGGGVPSVQVCGADLLDPPTTVVEIVRERAIDRRSPTKPKRARQR